METTILTVSYFPLLFRFFASSLSFSDERGVVLGAATGGVLAAFFAFLGIGGELKGVCSDFFAAGAFCFDFGAPAAARFRVAGTGGDWNRARSFFFDGGGAGGAESLFRFFFDEGAAGGGASPSVKPG